MIIRRRVGDLKHDAPPSFELIEAPIDKWPREIKKLRRRVFPRWFASDWLPALFRYRGWINIARLGGRTVGFALCDFFEGETGVYLEEVAVLPEHQGSHIGTSLVLECAGRAQEQGFMTMWATPLAGEEHRGLWLQKLGLLPNTDGVQSSLDEIVARIGRYLESSLRPML
ncbi:MAG: GNAT family N-acetyltransferase [Acidobacteria bacterium]|nr:GNAT family N-acetyltransferase [Acidobacteriota bacterium]